MLSKEFGDLAILQEEKRYLERWVAWLDTEVVKAAESLGHKEMAALGQAEPKEAND